MRSLLLSGLLAALTGTVAAMDLDWPQFRGPRGDGVSTSTGLPLTWSESENIAWSTPVHGKAWSSPVVFGNRVWLTTATEDGRELSVVSLDLATGRVVLDRRLFTVENPQFIHKFNSAASPTPVAADGRVYVSFGSPGTACLDAASGQVLWARRDIECNHYRGAGSSPILHGDLLILNFDGSDHQFVIALDRATGRTVWRRDRSIDFRDLGPDGQPEAEGDMRKAFATAHVAELDGRLQLLSQGAKAFYSYDPATGDELWRVEERTSHSGGTRPVVGHGLVFFPTGWSQGQVLAVRPGRVGEVLDANAAAPEGHRLEVVWRTRRSVPKKPALTLVDDLLFGIDDSGIATCWEATTGKVQWNERIGGNHSASPVVADGRIFFCSEEGETTVVATDRVFRKLAVNTLPDGFMASPAVAGRSLILRTRTRVYRIGER